MANAFVSPTGPAVDHDRENVTLVMCDACRLIQLEEIVPREVLFKQSLWVSGTATSTRRHITWFADRLATRLPAKTHGFLVEIMSNDGTTLEACRQVGFQVLGVDPSDVATEARRRGLPSVPEFFGAAVADRIHHEYGPADVIVARHAFAHTSELIDLIEGVKQLLRPRGRFFIEVPYALMLREEIQYDTIFHEHVTYWTVTSLVTFLGRHRLWVIDLTFIPLNGGSLLAEVTDEPQVGPDPIETILALEEVLCLNSPRGWQLFAQRVQDQRRGLYELLTGLVHQGGKVVGYGAAAKFMVMLNFCGITSDLLPLIGDASPRKQGLLCPGTRIPVVPPQDVIAAQPDYVLIGPWNLRDELMEFFREKLQYQGRFVLPLPIPQIV